MTESDPKVPSAFEASLRARLMDAIARHPEDAGLLEVVDDDLTQDQQGEPSQFESDFKNDLMAAIREDEAERIASGMSQEEWEAEQDLDDVPESMQPDDPTTRQKEPPQV